MSSIVVARSVSAFMDPPETITGQPMNRPWDAGDAGLWRTYVLDQKTDRMVRTACEQVQCDGWLHGWTSTFDERLNCGAEPDKLCAWRAAGGLPCGRCQAAYVRNRSGRTFTEQRAGDGLTVFTFDRHQRCFAEHKTRPQLFGIRDGDHRVPRGGRRLLHANGRDWVEDFGLHQQRVADQAQRG